MTDSKLKQGQDFSKALILGGARSGKSRYAEALCRRAGSQLVYIATAQAFDDEMTDRIARHKQDRGPDWLTIEEPVDLCAALTAVCQADRVVLVDCLTIWLSNLLLQDRNVTQAVAELTSVVQKLPGKIVFVANEVGLSIVPENKIARLFRDEAGLLNQKIAEVCETVIFVAAGLPMVLKAPDK